MWTHSTGIVELWIWLSFECEWNDDDDVVVDTQQFHIIFKLHIITAGHCFLFFRSISQISICCLGCGWVRMEYTMHSICTVHTLAIVELRSVPLTFVSSAHLLLLLSCVGRETHSRKTHIETAHCTFLVRINVYLMNCRWRQRSSHKHLDIRNQHSHFCSQKANRECVWLFSSFYFDTLYGWRPWWWWWWWCIHFFPNGRHQHFIMQQTKCHLYTFALRLHCCGMYHRLPSVNYGWCVWVWVFVPLLFSFTDFIHTKFEIKYVHRLKISSSRAHLTASYICV